jgi:hypothetical protein
MATELYDLQNAPWELRNAAQKPVNEMIVDRLHAQLEAWLKQQGDDPIRSEKEAVYRQKKPMLM